MRAARVSFACTLVLIVIFLGTHGGSDWSRSLAALWYGLLATAIVSALIGLAIAVFDPRQTAKRRLQIAALSLPAVLTAAAVLQLILRLSQDTS